MIIQTFSLSINQFSGLSISCLSCFHLFSNFIMTLILILSLFFYIPHVRYLFLFIKLPQNLAAKNNKHLLTNGFYGSGIQTKLSQVPVAQVILRDFSQGISSGSSIGGRSASKLPHTILAGALRSLLVVSWRRPFLNMQASP